MWRRDDGRLIVYRDIELLMLRKLEMVADSLEILTSIEGARSVQLQSWSRSFWRRCQRRRAVEALENVAGELERLAEVMEG